MQLERIEQVNERVRLFRLRLLSGPVKVSPSHHHSLTHYSSHTNYNIPSSPLFFFFFFPSGCCANVRIVDPRIV